MTKAEAKKAVAEKWRVSDDFGAVGTVVGADGPEHVLVRFDGEGDRPKVCHLARVGLFSRGTEQ